MTLDEAIRHCLEQAHIMQDKADKVDGDESRQCMECAADHIQLAEWLVELKDLRAEQHEQGVYIKELMKHSAADVQPVDRWISVEDRLPEEIGYYLVVIGNEMLVSIDIVEYSENRWHKHDKVLYWQPLPDYPEATKG